MRYLRELGADVVVKKNDELSLDGMQALRPSALVVSPGPCSPMESGVSCDAVRRFAGNVPVLGVCLGHQVIAQVFGGTIVKAHRPIHGKLSRIQHRQQGLMKGLPECFSATRYHSLVVSADSLPEALRVDAWSDDPYREIMALSHRELPVHGLQYHPEAILSEHGYTVLENFLIKYNLV